jgi:hypothetical protein
MSTLNKINALVYDAAKLKKLSWIDKLSFSIGKLLTSTILIILVMLTFLIGVAVHLKDVFNSWFLAIGMQAVILISSTNSDILPTIRLTKSKTLTLIPLIMSVLMCWYLFISFNGLNTMLYSTEYWTAMSKSVGVAATEYMFSYLFAFRYNKFINDLQSIAQYEKQQEINKLSADLNLEQQRSALLNKQQASISQSNQSISSKQLNKLV